RGSAGASAARPARHRWSGAGQGSAGEGNAGQAAGGETAAAPGRQAEPPMKGRTAAPELDGRLRVVAGRFKGRRLGGPPVLDIRPTSDGARQALFDMLAHRPDGIVGGHLLDGFAGTGAVGIEALSRGARHATFVDPAGAAQAAIRANLATCGAAD